MVYPDFVDVHQGDPHGHMVAGGEGICSTNQMKACYAHIALMAMEVKGTSNSKLVVHE